MESDNLKRYGERISIEKCYDCGEIIKIKLNMDLKGVHMIKCPYCSYEHCRIVENGEIISTHHDPRKNKEKGFDLSQFQRQPIHHAFTTKDWRKIDE